MQKLKMSFFHLLESLFTCFLKDKTLHNHWDYAGFTVPYYNIPSNNRELQPYPYSSSSRCHYNIPSNNRELQQIAHYPTIRENYNIPSNNRELQHLPSVSVQDLIITYQVITGNYSCFIHIKSYTFIITYQVITGNYSYDLLAEILADIITYQVITGNYSEDLERTLKEIL